MMIDHQVKVITPVLRILKPHFLTVVKNDAIMDFHIHSLFAQIVYLDSERLLKEVETVKLESAGVEVRAMSRKIEAIATVVLAKKFMEDPVFRATTVNIPRLAMRKRIVQQLIWRIKRKTY